MDKVTLKIDPEALTIGDLEDFEEIVGDSVANTLRSRPVYVDGQVLKDDRGRPVEEVNVSAKALKALVFITQRATNPDFTLADARNVRVASLEVVGDDEGNDESGTSD